MFVSQYALHGLMPGSLSCNAQLLCVLWAHSQQVCQLLACAAQDARHTAEVSIRQRLLALRGLLHDLHNCQIIVCR